MPGDPGHDSSLPGTSSRPEIRIKDTSAVRRVERCDGCRDVRDVAAKRKIGGSWRSLCRTCELAFLQHELKACEGCGALAFASDLFCGKCGASVQGKCKKCGAPLSTEDIFCGTCGEKR